MESPALPQSLPRVSAALTQTISIRHLFTVEEDQITVFGLFHCARNPQVISAILQNREK
jgi:hypothetical protein